MLSLDGAGQRRLRPGPRPARARRRLAAVRRRLADGSPTGWPRELRSLGGEIRDRQPGGVPRRAAARARRAPRPDAPADPAPGGIRAPSRLPPHPRAATATARASSRSTGRSTARSPGAREACARAGTVHLGGDARRARRLREGELRRPAGRSGPTSSLAQQSLFDPTRAPAGTHTAWAYCHVPNGSTVDMTGPITAQIERFAPGFRVRVLARHVTSRRDLERYNANDVGGDINGGLADLAPALPAARACDRCPTRRPTRASSSARPRPRPAAACTACAATTRLGRPCAVRSSRVTAARR